MKQISEAMKSVAVLATAWAAISVWAGNERGNGTEDYNPVSDSAWFAGAGPIPYCVEVAGGFDVPRETIDQAIYFAIESWKTYLLAKKVNLFRAPALRINTDFSKLPRCDGREALSFRLGASSDETNKHRETLYRPLAMAIRTGYDPETGRGKGFIWIAPPSSLDPRHFFPNWNSGFALKAVLVHELGHVFGVGHVEGTIMKAGLSSQIERTVPSRSDAGIDQYRELALCESCETKFWGQFDVNGGDGGEDAPYLIGRDLAGSEKASLVMESMERGVLEIEDKTGRVAMKIHLDNGVDQSFLVDNTPVFKVARRSNQEMRSESIRKTGYLRYGTIETPQGRKINIVLERNLNSMAQRSGLSIRFFREGHIRNLFEAMSWMTPPS
jgi:hypothetical protein